MDRRIIGILMLAHYVAICVAKYHQDIVADLLWLSHVALLMAAIGLIARQPLLTSSAFVAIAISHTFWIIDCAWLMVLDVSPLGMTVYLRDADALTWIATAHHFYLAPVLAWIVVCDHLWQRGSLLVAGNVLLYLIILSRILAPARLNVNYALHLLDGVNWGPIRAINAMPAPLDILVGTAVIVAVTMYPTAAILRHGAEKHAATS